MYKNPSLRNNFECNIANRELYKGFIKNVLNEVVASHYDGGNIPKFMGHKNFTSMSQKVSKSCVHLASHRNRPNIRFVLSRWVRNGERSMS
jgi:hypothetical protein